jgi:predicted RecA/RadA family phage recombinase
MKTFNTPGEALTLTAPIGGVVSGEPYLIGSLLVIAGNSATAGTSFQGSPSGLYHGTKVPTETWTAAAKVYWDESERLFTLDSDTGANPLVGVSASAVPAAVTLLAPVGSPADLEVSDNAFLVNDYTGMADVVVTITVARDHLPSVVHTLTEGVDFAAITSEAVSAAALAAAIDALPGVSAVHTSPGSPPVETVTVLSDVPVPGHVRLDGAAR